MLVCMSTYLIAQTDAQVGIPSAQKPVAIDVPNTSGVPAKSTSSMVFRKAPAQSSKTRSTSQAYKIGSSANIFTALLSQQHCLGYKKVGSSNVIYFFHRQCNGFVNSSDLAANGYTEADISLNGGRNWDSAMRRIFVRTNNGSLRPRYPSGDLFINNGDTSYLHALAVATGPVTNGTNWGANYFGFSSLDTTKKNYTIKTTSGVDFSFPRLATSASANHVWALGFVEDANTTTNSHFRGLGVFEGTYNASGDSFAWTASRIKLPCLFTHNTPSIKGDTGYYNIKSANMAWGADGKTGYIVACNIDSTPASFGGDYHYVYHIWKTTNEGLNWTPSVFDPSDTTTSKFCHIKDSLQPLRANAGKTNVYPLNDDDIIVDGDGNLHIVTGIAGQYSTSRDSVGYYYRLSGGHPYLVDFFQNKTGWNYFKIGRVLVPEVAASSSPYSDGSGKTLTWGTRIQASCDPTSNKIFYSWMDSDPTADSFNINPDIFVAALDLKKMKFKAAANLTWTNNFGGNIFWYYAARNIMTTTVGGKTTYTIPASFSEPFDPSKLNGGNPHEHYYLTGLTFTDDSFKYNVAGSGRYFSNCATGTQTIVAPTAITRVFPNPTNNNCTIEFVTTANAKVQISIANLLGQNVFTQNVTPAYGLNTLQVDMANFAPGVYLVSLKNGDTVSTYKLVKE